MEKRRTHRGPGLAICIFAGLAALGLSAFTRSPAYAETGTPDLMVCCRIPAGTTVTVELADDVSTKTYKHGDLFTLRLMAPVAVEGQVVLEAGTLGAGKVIDASRPGIGGKPAKIVLAASYLFSNGKWISLDALQLAGHGHDNSTPATILEIGGIFSAPAGVVGVILPGTDVGFKAGTIATARVESDVVLPPLRRATAAELGAAADLSPPSSGDVNGVINAAVPIPAPPPGKGQVVFFRAKTLLGTAQWFKVRENKKALGKLGNGAYFIQPEDPGVHTFTDKLEPELKDRLKLQIDPGQTYFVEGTLTAGLILSAADLEPSNVEKFNKAIKSMKRSQRRTDTAG